MVLPSSSAKAEGYQSPFGNARRLGVGNPPAALVSQYHGLTKVARSSVVTSHSKTGTVLGYLVSEQSNASAAWQSDTLRVSPPKRLRQRQSLMGETPKTALTHQWSTAKRCKYRQNSDNSGICIPNPRSLVFLNSG
ncbi:hypothetical protein SAMD00079811_35770 [Scytonema sp. HK-05]|uniref:hypothetical protein n=1 Tax=Scytonema sp. HK-05 TaxID=1137095 RepID=UPI0009373B9B|nr:hypothetical protein [Scytonema sp. HK-05]OKH60578.1 hypothetical protein NIES2130_02340 [Scytonema sp. HK-05]BAY45970.1 hypothetical protein SAMD00079811_35770 [Scytonema sp. HK-05]